MTDAEEDAQPLIGDMARLVDQIVKSGRCTRTGFRRADMRLRFAANQSFCFSRGEDSAALHECEFRDLSEDRKLKHGQTAGGLHSSVQAPILNRFRDVTGLDFFRACKVRNRPSNFEHTAVGAGAEAELIDCVFQELFGIVFEQAVTLDVAGAHLRIAMNVSLVEALQLNSPRSIDPLPNQIGTLSGIFTGEILVAQRRHLDLYIDTVEQRPGYSRAVTLNL